MGRRSRQSYKVIVLLGWWNSMILILPKTKIFDKIYACNVVCVLELALPYLLHQNLHQNCDFCLFFVYILNMFTILRTRLHCDVKVTSYVDGCYLFWYQCELEETYTLVANMVIRVYMVWRLVKKIQRGLQQYPFGGRVTENSSGGRGLKFIVKPIIILLCEYKKHTICIFMLFAEERHFLIWNWAFGTVIFHRIVNFIKILFTLRKSYQH